MPWPLQLSQRAPAAQQPQHPVPPQPATVECTLCLDDVVELVAFVPCGHRLACPECAATLLRTAPCTCPICRMPVTFAMRIFD